MRVPNAQHSLNQGFPDNFQRAFQPRLAFPLGRQTIVYAVQTLVNSIPHREIDRCQGDADGNNADQLRCHICLYFTLTLCREGWVFVLFTLTLALSLKGEGAG